MPTEDGLPAVGDVIASSVFMYAERSGVRDFLRILKLSDVPVAHIALPAPNGSVQTHPSVASGTGGDSYDHTRGTAEFVVEEAHWSDNPVTKSTGACSGRWYVAARRLNKDGTPRQSDERIAFLMCGLPDKFVLDPKDIQFVGTMRLPKQKKTGT